MPAETLRELFNYNRWANDRLLQAAVGMDDALLDRAFEMGPGSLRATLRHIYGAERTWFERVDAPGHASFPHSRDLTSIEALSDAAKRLSDARLAWLDGLDEEALDRAITFTRDSGETQTAAVRSILLHVCNHGTHHRAQAVNMLRHLGVPVPNADYLRMRKGDAASPRRGGGS